MLGRDRTLIWGRSRVGWEAQDNDGARVLAERKESQHGKYATTYKRVKG